MEKNEEYFNLINNLTSSFSEDEFYSTFISYMELGKNSVEVYRSKKNKTIDKNWVNFIESCVIPLDNIVRNPRKFIAREEEIVPIELSKTITTESVKHLAQHTNFIAEVTEDSITPNKILNINKEESFEIYENRFIYTLLLKLKDFIDKRMDLIANSMVDNDVVNLDVRSDFTYQGRVINYDLKINTKASTDDINPNDSEEMQIFERVSKLSKIINEFCASSFAQKMRKYPLVKPPITRTNVILKNPNFKKALTLWQFIETYDKVGFDVDNIESLEDISMENYNILKNNVFLDTIMYEKLLEFNNTNNKITKKTKYSPKFAKKFLEFVVENSDIDDVEFKKVFYDALNKTNPIDDKSVDEINLAIDNALGLDEDFLMAIQKKLEQEELERKQELERKRKEKEAEKERLRLEKEAKKAKLAEEKRLTKEKRDAELAEKKRLAEEKKLEEQKLKAKKAKEKEDKNKAVKEANAKLCEEFRNIHKDEIPEVLDKVINNALKSTKPLTMAKLEKDLLKAINDYKAAEEALRSQMEKDEIEKDENTDKARMENEAISALRKAEGYKDEVNVNEIKAQNKKVCDQFRLQHPDADKDLLDSVINKALEKEELITFAELEENLSNAEQILKDKKDAIEATKIAQAYILDRNNKTCDEFRKNHEKDSKDLIDGIINNALESGEPVLLDNLEKEYAKAIKAKEEADKARKEKEIEAIRLKNLHDKNKAICDGFRLKHKGEDENTIARVINKALRSDNDVTLDMLEADYANALKAKRSREDELKERVLEHARLEAIHDQNKAICDGFRLKHKDDNKNLVDKVTGDALKSNKPISMDNLESYYEKVKANAINKAKALKDKNERICEEFKTLHQFDKDEVLSKVIDNALETNKPLTVQRLEKSLRKALGAYGLGLLASNLSQNNANNAKVQNAQEEKSIRERNYQVCEEFRRKHAGDKGEILDRIIENGRNSIDPISLAGLENNYIKAINDLGNSEVYIKDDGTVSALNNLRLSNKQICDEFRDLHTSDKAEVLDSVINSALESDKPLTVQKLESALARALGGHNIKDFNYGDEIEDTVVTNKVVENPVNVSATGIGNANIVANANNKGITNGDGANITNVTTTVNAISVAGNGVAKANAKKLPKPVNRANQFLQNRTRIQNQFTDQTLAIKLLEEQESFRSKGKELFTKQDEAKKITYETIEGKAITVLQKGNVEQITNEELIDRGLMSQLKITEKVKIDEHGNETILEENSTRKGEIKVTEVKPIAKNNNVNRGSSTTVNRNKDGSKGLTVVVRSNSTAKKNTTTKKKTPYVSKPKDTIKINTNPVETKPTTTTTNSADDGLLKAAIMNAGNKINNGNRPVGVPKAKNDKNIKANSDPKRITRNKKKK